MKKIIAFILATVMLMATLTAWAAKTTMTRRAAPRPLPI